MTLETATPEVATAGDTLPAAEETASVRRVLQRLVLPEDRDMDVLPLYVDREQVRLDAERSVRKGVVVSEVAAPQVEHLEPDAILGRHQLRVRAGKRVSFGTYFNAFPASYWRMWTVVSSVRLDVRVAGDGVTLVVYRSTADGRAQRVNSVITENGGGDFSFELPLKPFGDGGWYWFDVLTGHDDAVVDGASWSALVPEDRAAQGTVTVGITTMNRPDFCSDLLVQVGSDPTVGALLDEVLVVEQGTQKVVDAESFPDAQRVLGDKLRVIEQGNIGGSGGFARAQFEALAAGRSTYVLFLDDDIVAEPESILRAATFADLARRPSIVGGHMFSLYAKSRLHSFGEVINRYRFWWESPGTVRPDWDFGERNLRSSRWMHRRIDVDFNGWFMCLIPLDVVRDIGLSLPLFIKWDDAEYGVRAADAGYPTVTFPGAAVWHVPWTDKNDALDWQAYFHQRNRIIAALLHSPYDRGGRMVKESFYHQVKHLFAMQYSTAELRHRAIEDVLAGPQQLHGDLLTKLPEIRALRTGYDDSRTKTDPDAFPPVRRKKPPKRGQDPTAPRGRVGVVATAVKSAVRQALPPRDLSVKNPEARLPAMDAKWWMIAQFDSVVVSTSDGTMASWYHRHTEEFQSLLRRTTAAHERLLREWPRLARRYQAALPEITSPEVWERTFAASTEDDT
ncbi:MAG: Bifunctional beta-1,5/1,6-galactofuranosyltransferase GlfT2 in cell wall galactan polymerization [uncultured Nocardioidaceae bacterium]|uniref:Bifunctional beta-1,5/1,6-galactofuranosyltransferase GlfT2 in cell wall galactan polymerization n=1 Tax=uncultured Nocardioidaceae bacterium TaxID=253824 RepID=A0A6J4N8R1_9ACTN|nr:MAG: Bifunctional beta-1,5/1,6-galactofuranosyltransferase GlfT2 in cell wall galactan polymerization [uncultured Nocardioidaceae bacterium]